MSQAHFRHRRGKWSAITPALATAQVTQAQALAAQDAYTVAYDPVRKNALAECKGDHGIVRVGHCKIKQHARKCYASMMTFTVRTIVPDSLNVPSGISSHEWSFSSSHSRN